MAKLLTEYPEWQALQSHQRTVAKTDLLDIVSHDSKRAQYFSLQAADLYCDFSKNYITPQTVELWIKLANACGLQQRIDDLFDGNIVNDSEQLPALHTALRQLSATPIYVDGKNIIPAIQMTLDKIRNLAERIQEEKYCGYSNKPISDIVNIGVGGSHWGPLLVYRALKKDYLEKPRCHFISNADPNNFSHVIANLDPQTTLFIVTSKSFSTAETLQNFHRAKEWLLAAAPNEKSITPQLIAVTAHQEKARELGFVDDNIFSLWPWVVGRFSIWSAVGLSVAITLGWSCFQEFLSGAFAMDQHFRHTDFSQNVPILLAFLSLWYNNFFNWRNQAIVPYSENLKYLPEYLQQLHMESLGKSCQKDGQPIHYPTGPILFGNIGTDSQHSFHQFFLQGTERVPIDFILPLKDAYTHQYQLSIIGNCLAQSRVLLQGYHKDEIIHDLKTQGWNTSAINQLLPHQYIQGGNPSTLILMEAVTPKLLGALLALYEHKVYVQSVIWNIDAFDQWGIEHGKKSANEMLKALQAEPLSPNFDPSTRALIQRILTFKN